MDFRRALGVCAEPGGCKCMLLIGANRKSMSRRSRKCLLARGKSYLQTVNCDISIDVFLVLIREKQHSSSFSLLKGLLPWISSKSVLMLGRKCQTHPFKKCI